MASFSRLIADIALQYPGDDVFVIGKGCSLDEVDLELANGHTVINVNDSERIYRGGLCFFHRPWVLESLRQSEPRCAYYAVDESVDCTLLAEAGRAVCLLPFVPFTMETADLFVHRLLAGDPVIEEVLFISALRAALELARVKGRRQHVYLLGFDFAEGPRLYSRRLGRDFSCGEGAFKSSFLRAQESLLLQVLTLIQEGRIPELELTHVGDKPYSRLNARQFNCVHRHHQLAAESVPKILTGEETHSPEAPARGSVLVVAEFTNNHLGNVARLREMVRLAAESGADLIKVQKRDVGGFYSPDDLNSAYSSPFGQTLGDYRRGVELGTDGFEALEEECRNNGVDWFASVLDSASYLFLRPFMKRFLKLPSTISERHDLHKAVAADFRGNLVVSTGFTGEGYVRYIRQVFRQQEKLYLLHTVSSYPTPPHECSIAVVRRYRDLSMTDACIIPGYSSHDAGVLGSLLAVAAGARMIEKHVKLGDAPWVHFNHVALDLSDGSFARFVRDVRLAETICGNEVKSIQKSEHHKYFRAAEATAAI